MSTSGLHIGRSLIIALVLVGMSTGWLRAESIEPQKCAEHNVRVASTNPREFAGICVAVRTAAAFLRTIGVEIPAGLFIVTAANWPAMDQTHVLAEYDCRTHAVRIVSLDQALAGNPGLSALGAPMTPSLWRSSLVHEIVHAAVHQMRSCTLRTLVMTEYIAAVAQLLALADQDRAMVLSHYGDLTGFDDPDQISETYYAIDPARFAVNAYLHYRKPGNGAKFIRTLFQKDGTPSPTWNE